jgi:hypothetical protein
MQVKPRATAMPCGVRDGPSFLLTRKKRKRTYGIDFIASCNSVPLAIVIPFKDIGGGGVGLKIEEGKKLEVD